MVWYYMLIGVVAIIAVKLLVPYIKKRYIDVPTARCPVCNNAYEGRSYPRCDNG